MVYLIISIFTAFFGAVYEVFSHGIYSYYMIYAFAFPLVFGVLPFLLITLIPRCAIPSYASRSCLHAAVATATVGSIIQGVLDIYGTDSMLVIIYAYASALLFTASMVLYFVQIFTKK